MTHSIKQLFHVEANKSEVFKALTSIDDLSKWWTKETTGDSNIGGIIKFRFAENGGPDMKVIGLQTDEYVKWKCVESPHGWVGHNFNFTLDDNDGKTRVRFSHDGWEENDDFYAICSFSWGRYMESLRQLCQTGKGEAFGSEHHRK